jgi:phosphonatase-like hydrolase
MAEKIELVVFDLAGTTVDDTIHGLPLVTVAMTEAFASRGIKISPEQVNKYRGMDKKQALSCLLKECQEIQMNNCDSDKLKNINDNAFLDAMFKDFKLALNSHLININKEIPGTTEIFYWLKTRGIKIAVGSGFPHDVVLALVEKLGWKNLVQYVSSAEQEGYSRPHPSLVHSAMKHCSVTDKRNVLKVGDTVMDVEEGNNAGCRTVAVLTGTQTESTLKQSNPDYIINSVADLPKLLEQLPC